MSNASISNIRCSIRHYRNCYEAKNDTQFPLSNEADAFSNSRTIVLMDLGSKGTEMNTPLITSNNKHSIESVKHGPLYRTPFFREFRWKVGYQTLTQCEAKERQRRNTVDFIQSKYKNSSKACGKL